MCRNHEEAMAFKVAPTNQDLLHRVDTRHIFTIILLTKFLFILCIRVEEFWEPKMDGLVTLVVERRVPTIHILLSKELICAPEHAKEKHK